MLTKINLRLKHLFKTTTQLGITQVSLFALYKLGLKTGYYKRISQRPIPDSRFPLSDIEHLFTLPSPEKLKETLGAEGRKDSSR